MMPYPAAELSDAAFLAALHRAGLSLPKAELASVLQTARWLHASAARVATAVAEGAKAGGDNAPL